jgi:cation diffusion facilitator family transporter
MTFAGYEAGRASIERFLSGGLAVQPGWPTLALLISAGIKSGMFFLIRNIAHRVSSPTLETVAQDNLSDVLTSIAAFLGVLGSTLIHPLSDPIAGSLVSLWILRAAWNAWKENLRYLTGGGAPPELREEIMHITMSIPGVRGVHQIITEYAGTRLVADLHVDVDGSLAITEAHRISNTVQEELEALPEIDRAYIHIEPLIQEVT